MSAPSICLLTPTWRGDLDHFRLLRRSLIRFGLSEATHHVVVQTEDRALFAPLVSGGMQLHTTAEILPPEVEAGRVECLRRSRHDNRHIAKLRRSLNKRFGWFNWVRHYGWQIQQITKLHAPTVLDADIFVVLDSDLILCKPLRLEEFAPDGKALLMECPMQLKPGGPGLEYRWVHTAHQLLGRSLTLRQPINTRLGTPFVFHRAVLRALHAELERRHDRPWHQVLLSQKPASWSEFALYNCISPDFIGTHLASGYGAGKLNGMVLDSSEQRQNARCYIEQALQSPNVRFFILQSESKNGAPWSAAEFERLLEHLLFNPEATTAS